MTQQASKPRDQNTPDRRPEPEERREDRGYWGTRASLMALAFTLIVEGTEVLSRRSTESDLNLNLKTSV